MAPPMHDPMNPMGRHGGTAAMVSRQELEKEDQDAELYGNVPEGKRRKFILVDDAQRHNRVRVKVMLDSVEMSEIPDSFRRLNSVYPRSYYPVQMRDQSPSALSKGDRMADEAGDEEDSSLPTIGRTLVPVHMVDGEGEIPVPKISRHKKRKERQLNELGYRMAWSQSRVFANRTIFLQKSCRLIGHRKMVYVHADKVQWMLTATSSAVL